MEITPLKNGEGRVLPPMALRPIMMQKQFCIKLKFMDIEDQLA